MSRLLPLDRLARLRGQLEEDFEGRPPRFWYRRKPPRKKRVCYRVKSDALREFLDWNWKIVEEYGGESYPAGCSEFDAVNHKLGLDKKSCARSISDAVWHALPGSGHRGGPPYCLDQIDLEALNDTAPGRIGPGFELPDRVLEYLAEREQEARYDDLAIHDMGASDCFTSFRHRGRFVGRKMPDTKQGREHRCVCRDEQGRFASCSVRYPEDVPF